MNRFLWVLQVLFGAFFIFNGVTHLILPDGLPGRMEWMYDLSETVHLVSGTAEILGGLGLVLPGLTKVMPRLTVWAATGLALVMVSAAVWHISRGEVAMVAGNLVAAAATAFIAYARARRHPLAGSLGVPAV